jgi:5-formyltetrahydrofolate cyclo-ligase
MLNSDKAQLRKKLLNLRNRLNDKEIKLYSQIICSKLNKLDIFVKSKHVAIYHAINNEVHLDNLLIQPPAIAKQFYLPIVQQNWALKFYPYKINDPLSINQWGISEPIPTQPPINLHQIEIIILPMLGFCKSGARLGMGKACYDRTLQQENRPTLIGVAFSINEIDTFNQEPHDVLMDVIITEKNVFDISGKCD